jgi:hypothetical protein
MVMDAIERWEAEQEAEWAAGSCAACIYWRQIGEDIGQCHRPGSPATRMCVP